MVIKTMSVFFDAQGLPYKDMDRKVHFPIVEPANQGSSQVNEIKFYVDKMASEAQWIAVAKLPNGKQGVKLLTSEIDNHGEFVKLSLSSFFTQAKGNLVISLRGYEGGATITYNSETEEYEVSGDPIIQTTGSVSVNIRYATQIQQGDESEEITLEDIYAELGNKVDKTSVSYRIYGTTGGGAQYLYTLSVAASGNTIPFRDENGQLFVVQEPTNDNNATSKHYVDTSITNSIENYLPLSAGSTKPLTGDLYLGDHTIYIDDTLKIQGFGTTTRSIDLRKGNSLLARFQVGTAIFSDIQPLATNSHSLGSENYGWRYLYITKGLKRTGSSQKTLLIPSTSSWDADRTIATTKDILDAISSAYIYKGSKTVAQINALNTSTLSVGWIYNVSDSGTITLGSLSVVAGDNIAWTGDAWDKLAGTVDLSNYVTNTSLASTLESYVTYSALATTLANYVTSSSLSTTLGSYVQTSRTIAGVALTSDISAQALTNALVLATTSDITSIMED